MKGGQWRSIQMDCRRSFSFFPPTDPVKLRSYISSPQKNQNQNQFKYGGWHRFLMPSHLWAEACQQQREETAFKRATPGSLRLWGA